MPFPKGAQGAKAGGGGAAKGGGGGQDACGLCQGLIDHGDSQGYIIGTCSICGERPFHFDCVADYAEKQVKLTNTNVKAREKGRNIARNRPQDLFAQNRTVQRKQQKCVDSSCHGFMVGADLIKPSKPVEEPAPAAPPAAAPAPAPAKKVRPAAAPAPAGKPQAAAGPAVLVRAGPAPAKHAPPARTASAGSAASASSGPPSRAGSSKEGTSAAVKSSSVARPAATAASKQAAAKEQQQQQMAQLRAAAAAARASIGSGGGGSAAAARQAANAAVDSSPAKTRAARRELFLKTTRLTFESGQRPRSLQMCLNWEQTGACPYPDCPFCHSTDQLIAREDEWLAAAGKPGALGRSGSTSGASRQGGSAGRLLPLQAASSGRLSLQSEPPEWGADEVEELEAEAAVPSGGSFEDAKEEHWPALGGGGAAAAQGSWAALAMQAAAEAEPAWVPAYEAGDPSLPGFGLGSEAPLTPHTFAGPPGSGLAEAAAPSSSSYLPEDGSAELDDGPAGSPDAFDLAAALRRQQEQLLQSWKTHGTGDVWTQQPVAAAAPQAVPAPALAPPVSASLFSQQQPWEQPAASLPAASKQAGWEAEAAPFPAADGFPPHLPPHLSPHLSNPQPAAARATSMASAYETQLPWEVAEASEAATTWGQRAAAPFQAAAAPFPSLAPAFPSQHPQLAQHTQPDEAEVDELLGLLGIA